MRGGYNPMELIKRKGPPRLSLDFPAASIGYAGDHMMRIFLLAACNCLFIDVAYPHGAPRRDGVREIPTRSLLARTVDQYRAASGFYFFGARRWTESDDEQKRRDETQNESSARPSEFSFITRQFASSRNGKLYRSNLTELIVLSRLPPADAPDELGPA
jgi:hypothetical protein